MLPRLLLRQLPHVRAPCQALQTVRSNAAVTAAATTTVLRAMSTEGNSPKGKRWENVERWVLFSDLHVNVRSLEVCISVLRKIKKEAVARKAGILFLGKLPRREK